MPGISPDLRQLVNLFRRWSVVVIFPFMKKFPSIWVIFWDIEMFTEIYSHGSVMVDFVVEQVCLI